MVYTRTRTDSNDPDTRPNEEPRQNLNLANAWRLSLKSASITYVNLHAHLVDLSSTAHNTLSKGTAESPAVSC